MRVFCAALCAHVWKALDKEWNGKERKGCGKGAGWAREWRGKAHGKSFVRKVWGKRGKSVGKA